jgi:Flp pilus assembly pilin Flp
MQGHNTRGGSPQAGTGVRGGKRSPLMRCRRRTSDLLEAGQAAVEYALILALVALLAIAGIAFVSEQLDEIRRAEMAALERSPDASGSQPQPPKTTGLGAFISLADQLMDGGSDDRNLLILAGGVALVLLIAALAGGDLTVRCLAWIRENAALLVLGLGLALVYAVIRLADRCW